MRLCPDARVWIMANTESHGQNGCPESIDRAIKLGADGMILNDIRMATGYFASL